MWLFELIWEGDWLMVVDILNSWLCNDWLLNCIIVTARPTFWCIDWSPAWLIYFTRRGMIGFNHWFELDCIWYDYCTWLVILMWLGMWLDLTRLNLILLDWTHSTHFADVKSFKILVWRTGEWLVWLMWAKSGEWALLSRLVIDNEKLYHVLHMMHCYGMYSIISSLW